MNRAKYKIILLISLISTPTLLLAGETPIFNSDLPGGSGDWENHARNLTAECEITTGNYKGIYRSDESYEKLPKGYYCRATGSWCANRDTVPLNTCVNTKVRWLWDGGSTPWFDRDLPSGNADYESIELQLEFQCIFGTQIYYPEQSLPKGYVCDNLLGAWCENSKTQPINSCRNAPVTTRYFW